MVAYLCFNTIGNFISLEYIYYYCLLGCGANSIFIVNNLAKRTLLREALKFAIKQEFDDHHFRQSRSYGAMIESFYLRGWSLMVRGAWYVTCQVERGNMKACLR